jgi:homoserine dehydrogenase
LQTSSFFYGKGAGSFPTDSAALSDISVLRYEYHYGYKKLYHHKPHQFSDDFYLRVYISFSNGQTITKEKFAWIEEWHTGQKRNYRLGLSHFLF